MKTISVPRKGSYANPKVSVPHLLVENNGDVVEVDDDMASRMCAEHGATQADPVVEDDSDFDETEDDDSSDDAVEALADAHGRKILIAACKQKGLDVTGNKTDLAARLVEAGVTEITTE